MLNEILGRTNNFKYTRKNIEESSDCTRKQLEVSIHIIATTCHVFLLVQRRLGMAGKELHTDCNFAIR